MFKPYYLRFARIYIFVAAIFTLIWLTSPVGPGPGTPLRMFSSDGSDLQVAALTYSQGPDPRWLRLGEQSVSKIPSRLLLALNTFEMGSGQELALQAAEDAAAYVLGTDELEQPVGVYPGIVSGTSSGLAWAVATILLNDPELRKNRVIFATGSIHGSEGVGSINGLAEKLSTPGLKDATVIFVPQMQFEDAFSILNQDGEFATARLLVGVSTITEALAYLCDNESEAKSCKHFLRT